MRPILFTIASLFLISSFAFSQISVTVEGTTQGKFKSETNRTGKDKIDLIGYTQEMAAPRDIATGQMSGKRQYQPLTIIKSVGASSPQFFQALLTNEVLKKVVIELTKANADGAEYVYYTITLEDVTVANYKQYSATSASDDISATKHSGTMSNAVYDEIKLSFRKITVESKDGKTIAGDGAKIN